MLVLAPNQTVEKYPYTLGDLRKDNPNTSFSKNPTENQLAAFNVFCVERSSEPNFDQATQKRQELNPVLENSKWVQAWSVMSLSIEEQEQRKKDRADQVRGERNSLILESDWTQLPDAPVDKAAWATYRQALRDLTDQAGFPFSVVWPSQPT
jgi:hypothetical protein